MILYYAPGACSLAAHIVLHETGLEYTLDRVNLSSRVTASGKNYLEVNPLGYVPTLELSESERLSELPVILQYLGDRVPERALVPAPASADRYRIQAWMNFIGTEIHKGFGPLFADDTPIHYRPILKERLRGRFAHVDQRLKDSPFLMGEHFSVADAHLWVMIKWTRLVGIDPDQWAALIDFEKRVGARESARRALVEEDLNW